MEVDWDSFYASLDETAPPPPGVLDMEASGFGRDSYPIEVGYVLPTGIRAPKRSIASRLPPCKRAAAMWARWRCT